MAFFMYAIIDKLLLQNDAYLTKLYGKVKKLFELFIF